MKALSFNNLLRTIKLKFIALYILNVLDILFTLMLYQSGLFMECNALMAILLERPIVSILVKTIIPLLLILFINKRINEANKRQLEISNKWVTVILIVYILINMMHILNTILLISLK